MSGGSNPNLDFGQGVDDMMELYDFLDAGGDSLLGILESGVQPAGESRERGLSMSLEHQHHQAMRPASMVSSPAVGASPRRSPAFGAPLLPALNGVPVMHPFSAAHHQLSSGGHHPAYLPAPGEAVPVRPAGKQSHHLLEEPLSSPAGGLGGLRDRALHGWQPDLFASEGSSGRAVAGRGRGGGASAPALRRDRRPSARLYAAAEEMGGSSAALLGALASGSAVRRARRMASGRGAGEAAAADLGGGGLIFGQDAPDAEGGAAEGADDADPYPEDQEQQFAVTMLATVRHGRGRGAGAGPPGLSTDAYPPSSLPAGIGDGASGAEDGAAAAQAPSQQQTRAPPGRRKRFLWSELLHKQFTACIFDFGLKTVTPRLLFDQMHPVPREMTSDHIKSHLQKYRLNVKAGREAFEALYSQSLAEATAAAEAAALATGAPPYPVQFSTYPVAIVARPDPTGCSDSAAILARDVPPPRPNAPCHRCEVVDRLSALGIGFLLDDEGEPISSVIKQPSLPPVDEGCATAGLDAPAFPSPSRVAVAASDHEEGMGLDVAAAAPSRDRRRASSLTPAAPSALDPALAAALAVLLPSLAAREEVLALSPSTLALLAPVLLIAAAQRNELDLSAAPVPAAAPSAVPSGARLMVLEEAAPASVAGTALASAPPPARPAVTFAPEPPACVEVPAGIPPEAGSGASLNLRQAALAIDMSKHMTWHRKMRERQEGQMLAYGSGAGDAASLLGGERGSDGGDVTPTTRQVMAEMLALGGQLPLAPVNPSEAALGHAEAAPAPVRHFTASAAAESVAPQAVPFAPMGTAPNIVAVGPAAPSVRLPSAVVASSAATASAAADALLIAAPSDGGVVGRSPAATSSVAPLPRGMRDDATAISALLSFERRPHAVSDVGGGVELYQGASSASGGAPNESNQSNSSESVAGSEAAAADDANAVGRSVAAPRALPPSLRNSASESGTGDNGAARDGGDDRRALDGVLTALQLPPGTSDQESVAATLACIDSLLSLEIEGAGRTDRTASGVLRSPKSGGFGEAPLHQRSAAFLEAMAAVRQVPAGPGVPPTVLLSFLNASGDVPAQDL